MGSFVVCIKVGRVNDFCVERNTGESYTKARKALDDLEKMSYIYYRL